MLSCQELTEVVTDYLEGRLSPWRRLQFEMHIGMCRHCRAYLRQMKATVEVLGRMPSEPMPADVRDALAARLAGLLPQDATADAGVPRPLALLAWLDRAGRGRRPIVIAGAVIIALLSSLVLQGVTAGPPCNGLLCTMRELGAGLLLALGLFGLASAWHARMPPGAYLLAGLLGALPVYVALQCGWCPLAHLAAHALTYHVGGVVGAAALGWGFGRVPALR